MTLNVSKIPLQIFLGEGNGQNLDLLRVNLILKATKLYSKPNLVTKVHGQDG